MLSNQSKNVSGFLTTLKQPLKRVLTYFLIVNLVTQNFLYATAPLLQVEFMDARPLGMREGIALKLNGDIITHIAPQALIEQDAMSTDSLSEDTQEDPFFAQRVARTLQQSYLQTLGAFYNMRIKQKDFDCYQLGIKGDNFKFKVLFDSQGNVVVRDLFSFGTDFDLATIGGLGLEEGCDLNASVLSLSGATITNGADLSISESLTLCAQSEDEDAVMNTPQGRIRLAGRMTLKKGHMLQEGALEIAAEGAVVDLEGHNFTHTLDSHITGEGSLAFMNGAGLDLQGPIELSQEDGVSLSVQAQHLEVSEHLSAHTVTLNAQNTVLSPSSLIEGEDVTLAGHEANLKGRISARNQATLNSTTTLVDEGVLVKAQTLNVLGATFTNAGDFVARDLNIVANLVQNSGLLKGHDRTHLFANQKIFNRGRLETPHLNLLSPEFYNTGTVDIGLLSGKVFQLFQNSGQFNLQRSTLSMGGIAVLGQLDKAYFVNTPSGHFNVEDDLNLEGNVYVKNKGTFKAGKAFFKGNTNIVNKNNAAMSFGQTNFDLAHNTFQNEGTFIADHVSGSLKSFHNIGTSRVGTSTSGTQTSPQGWHLSVGTLSNMGTLSGPGHIKAKNFENLGQMIDAKLILEISETGKNLGTLFLLSLVGTGHFTNQSDLSLSKLGIASFVSTRGTLSGGASNSITLLKSLNTFTNDEDARVSVSTFFMEEKEAGALEATLTNKGYFKAASTTLSGKVRHEGTFKTDTFAWTGSILNIVAFTSFKIKSFGAFVGKAVSQTTLAFQGARLSFSHLVTQARLIVEKAPSFVVTLLENKGAFILKDTYDATVKTLTNDANATATFDKTNNLNIEAGTNAGVLGIRDSSRINLRDLINGNIFGIQNSHNITVNNFTSTHHSKTVFDQSNDLKIEYFINASALSVNKVQNLKIKNLSNLEDATAVFSDIKSDFSYPFMELISNAGALNVKNTPYLIVKNFTNQIGATAVFEHTNHINLNGINNQGQTVLNNAQGAILDNFHNAGSLHLDNEGISSAFYKGSVSAPTSFPTGLVDQNPCWNVLFKNVVNTATGRVVQDRNVFSVYEDFYNNGGLIEFLQLVTWRNCYNLIGQGRVTGINEITLNLYNDTLRDNHLLSNLPQAPVHLTGKFLTIDQDRTHTHSLSIEVDNFHVNPNKVLKSKNLNVTAHVLGINNGTLESDGNLTYQGHIGFLGHVKSAAGHSTVLRGVSHDVDPHALSSKIESGGDLILEMTHQPIFRVKKLFEVFGQFILVAGTVILEESVIILNNISLALSGDCTLSNAAKLAHLISQEGLVQITTTMGSVKNLLGVIYGKTGVRIKAARDIIIGIYYQPPPTAMPVGYPVYPQSNHSSIISGDLMTLEAGLNLNINRASLFSRGFLTLRSWAITNLAGSIYTQGGGLANAVTFIHRCVYDLSTLGGLYSWDLRQPDNCLFCNYYDLVRGRIAKHFSQLTYSSHNKGIVTHINNSAPPRSTLNVDGDFALNIMTPVKNIGSHIHVTGILYRGLGVENISFAYDPPSQYYTRMRERDWNLTASTSSGSPMNLSDPNFISSGITTAPQIYSNLCKNFNLIGMPTPQSQKQVPTKILITLPQNFYMDFNNLFGALPTLSNTSSASKDPSSTSMVAPSVHTMPWERTEPARTVTNLLSNVTFLLPTGQTPQSLFNRIMREGVRFFFSQDMASFAFPGSLQHALNRGYLISGLSIQGEIEALTQEGARFAERSGYNGSVFTLTEAQALTSPTSLIVYHLLPNLSPPTLQPIVFTGQNAHNDRVYQNGQNPFGTLIATQSGPEGGIDLTVAGDVNSTGAFVAKGPIKVSSQGDTTIGAMTTKHSTSHGFQERAAQNTGQILSTESSVEILARNFTGVGVHMEGTSVKTHALENSIITPLQVSGFEHHQHGETTVTIQTLTNHLPTTKARSGDVSHTADGHSLRVGHKIDAAGKILAGGVTSTQERPAVDSKTITVRTEKDGFFSSSVSTHISSETKNIGCQNNAGVSTQLGIGGTTTLQASKVDTPELILSGHEINLLTAQNTHQEQYFKSETGFVMSRVQQSGSTSTTPVPCQFPQGNIEFRAFTPGIKPQVRGGITPDDSQHNTPLYQALQQLQESNEDGVDIQTVHPTATSYHFDQKSLGTPLRICLSIGMMVMMGPGSGAFMGVTTPAYVLALKAGIACAGGQFANGLVAHNGNPFQAMGDVVEPKALLATAIAAASAGITHGVAGELADMAGVNLNLAREGLGFLEHFQAALVQTAASLPVQAGITATMGGDVVDSVRSSLMMGAASLIGSYGSSRIGKAFHAGNLDPFSQKLLHGALGAASAAIMGGEPVAGAIGAIVGEIIGETYREGGFGNTPLDQNSDTYQTQVEYGVAFAKMAAVMCVGIMGGDVEAAAFTAENAARYNCFAIHDILELNALQMQRDSAQTDEERARLDNLIENSVLKTQERGAQFVVDQLSKDLPDPVLGAITSFNKGVQRTIDRRERVFQSYDQISPALGTALRVVDWQTTVGLHMAELPTSQGGAFLTLVPGLKYVGAAGKVALNTVKGSVKSMVSALREAGTNASRLGTKPLSMQGASSTQTTCLLADRANKAPYDPRAMESFLHARYGKEAVTSSTLPSSNMPNVKLAGQAHSETSVVFCQRGMPVFDNVARFDTRISMETASIRDARLHMRAATRNLRDEIQAGRVSPDLFTPNQLQDIKSGKAKIEGLTWHHHQDRSRLQLILEESHDTNHVGGMHLWFSGQ